MVRRRGYRTIDEVPHRETDELSIRDKSREDEPGVYVAPMGASAVRLGQSAAVRLMRQQEGRNRNWKPDEVAENAAHDPTGGGDF